MVSALRNTSGRITALPRFSTTPPSCSDGSEAANRRKSRWLVSPIAAPLAAGCWWMISAPIAACTVSGTPIVARAREQRELGMRQLQAIERARERLAHPPLLALTANERLVHLTTRFLRHSERAVAKASLHVFARAAPARDLVVVNRGRAVHREVRDDAAAHEVDEDRREPRFHDVSADHHDDASLPCSARDVACEREEVARREHARERAEERSEGAVVTRRLRELLRTNLVRSARDRNRAHRGQIGFGSAQPGGIVGGVYDLRKRSRVLSTGIFALS